MSEFRLGVIEGFFGNPWSWADRLAYPAHLAKLGYSDFIYAPKADRYLRKDWRLSWPDNEVQNLKALSARCTAHSIRFGVGFSPYEVYLDWGALAQREIREKVSAIVREFAPSVIAVLFDDMKGDVPDLARIQSEVVSEVRLAAPDASLLMCPTYYSTDAVLERVFGTRPDGYFEELGKRLESDVQIFWTGERVISEAYSIEHLDRVASVFQRKITLWDNYPVNDTKKLSDFLLLSPFRGRPSSLRNHVHSHYVNPMKQANLSLLPLGTLPDIYGGFSDGELLGRALGRLESQGLRDAIAVDLTTFCEIGLCGLSADEKARLRAKYDAMSLAPMCREIVRWLDGADAFDPECLTT